VRLSPALQEAASQAEAERAVQGIADMDCWEKHITYEPLDMKDGAGAINVTREATPLACQQRCEQTSECMHFAYWVPQGDCHLQDVFAIRNTNRIGFVSGPQRCYRDDEDALSHGMARLRSKGVGDYTFVPVEFSCLEVSTMYNGFRNVQPTSFNVTPADQDPLQAMSRCQQLCRDTEGCAHFTIGAPGLQCALAGAKAPSVFPIFRHVSGPPGNCTELLYQEIGRPTQTTTAVASTDLGEAAPEQRGAIRADGSGAPAWLWAVVALAGLCCLAAVIAAAGMSSAKKERKTRSIERLEDDSRPDSFMADNFLSEDPPTREASASLPAQAAATLRAPMQGPLRPMLTALTQWPWSPWAPAQRQFRYTAVPSTEKTVSGFDSIDLNHDGVIDRNEFNQALARSQPRATTYAIPRAATYAHPRAATFVASPRAPPMASVRVTGPSLNRGGIPDALQQAPAPSAQAFSVPARARQPPLQPARLLSAPRLPHAPQAPARLASASPRLLPAPPHAARQAPPLAGARLRSEPVAGCGQR
ncbi:unnamed protein product, partial [Prorocentrum cordatum]